MISVRLSEEEYSDLRRLCSTTGARSVSDITRDAMRVLVNGSNRDDILTIHIDEFRTQMRSLDRKIEQLSAEITSFTEDLFLPGKALHLLLRAAARLPKDLNFSIEILGDGPCNRTWRSMASRLGIDNRCHWHGWIPRDQSLAIMRNSHVFAITSLKDLTSTVAVEAISLGLPVITLNHCGFSDLVSEECGIKINPGSAAQIVADLASALSTLYRDEALRERLAQGAIRRSREYSWQAKMETLDEIYRVAIAGNERHGSGAPNGENGSIRKDDAGETDRGSELSTPQTPREITRQITVAGTE